LLHLLGDLFEFYELGLTNLQFYDPVNKM